MIEYELKKKDENALGKELKAAIRKAWRSPKHQIKINGKVFNIKKTSRAAKYQVKIGQDETEQRTQVERWLVVTPADGGMVPMYHIEFDDGCNQRS